MKWNRWLLILAALLSLQLAGFAAEKELPPSAVPAGAPIVIENLHIDRIENLTVHAVGPTVPPVPEKLGSVARQPGIVSKVIPERRIENAPTDLIRSVDRDSPFRKPGLEIHIFNIGQADSTLVLGPKEGGKRKCMLIDLGETSPKSKNYVAVAEKIRELTGGTHVDYFVATHYHSDHLGGAENGIAGLLKELNFQIDVRIDIGDDGAKYFGNTPRLTYDNYQETMSTMNVTPMKPKFGTGQIILGGNVIVDILAFAGKVGSKPEEEDSGGALAEVQHRSPQQYVDEPPSENDLSIAMKISSGKFEYFTAGDLTGAEDNWGGERLFTPHQHGSTYTNVESRLVKHWKDAGILQDVEVYRVNHHGSSFSTTDELLTALDPEFMIYSCATRYDHPTLNVVERGAKTARQFVTTALSPKSWPDPSLFAQYNGEVIGGDITIYVDYKGDWYWINDELHRAYSDEEEKQDKDVGEEFTEWQLERE